MTRYDADEVRLALRSTPHSVLAALGLESRGRHEIVSRTCPSATHSKRRSFVFDVPKAVWRCFPCGTSGDLLALVAKVKGLSARRDFPRVLELAAELANVRPMTSDPEDAERRRRDLRERMEAERVRVERMEREQAEERDRAIAAAAAEWPTLATRSERGEAYVIARGLDPDQLGRRLRYDADGLAVALHNRHGHVRNIVTRHIEPDADGEKVIRGRLAAPPTGTLVGHVDEIDEMHDVAVLCEGVIDSLTAIEIFPTAIVLGAHGADQMAAIVRVVVPRIRAFAGWLLVVPHNDEAGVREGIAAVRGARDAGLVLGDDLHLVDLGGEHNDLNDAHRAGWRWSWPRL